MCTRRHLPTSLRCTAAVGLPCALWPSRPCGCPERSRAPTSSLSLLSLVSFVVSSARVGTRHSQGRMSRQTTGKKSRKTSGKPHQPSNHPASRERAERERERAKQPKKARHNASLTKHLCFAISAHHVTLPRHHKKQIKMAASPGIRHGRVDGYSPFPSQHGDSFMLFHPSCCQGSSHTAPPTGEV